MQLCMCKEQVVVHTQGRNSLAGKRAAYLKYLALLMPASNS